MSETFIEEKLEKTIAIYRKTLEVTGDNGETCFTTLDRDTLELLEEYKKLIDSEKNRCKYCAGCTEWNADCANIRAKAIDEFAEKLYNKSTDLRDIESDDYGILHYEDVYEVAEELKGGAE